MREVRHLVHPLSRPQHGGSLVSQSAHEGSDPPGAFWVEVVGGLVHQQHLRAHEHRARHRQTLLHPVRAPSDGPIGHFGEPDQVQHLPRAPAGLAELQTVQTSEEDQVLQVADPQVEGSVAGRDEADPPLVRTVPRWGSPVRQRTRMSVVLPAPFGPEQRMNLAGSDRQIDPVERRLVTETADHAPA